jgi:hypothetical protein
MMDYFRYRASQQSFSAKVMASESVVHNLVIPLFTVTMDS